MFLNLKFINFEVYQLLIKLYVYQRTIRFVCLPIPSVNSAVMNLDGVSATLYFPITCISESFLRRAEDQFDVHLFSLLFLSFFVFIFELFVFSSCHLFFSFPFLLLTGFQTNIGLGT